MKNLLFTLAGIATFAFSACDNDDDDMSTIEPTATRMEMITDRDWVLVSEVESGDLPDALRVSPFAKDDIFRFHANGEAIRDEGPSKEEGAPQVVEVAKWSFMNEEHNLDAGFKTLPLSDEIVELTKKRMVLRRKINGAEKITTFLAQ